MKDVVYLICFARPYHHARHYLGTTKDLKSRLATHLAGRGSPLVRAVVRAGIGCTVVRTWKGGRTLERRLKNGKNVPRLCPRCSCHRTAR